MYILKLFRHDDPTRQLMSKQLERGVLTIGRDAGADWRIDDPNREISRLHCTISATGTGLSITDTSTNGILVGAERRRLPTNRAVPLALGDALHLGGFVLTVERAPDPEFRAPSLGGAAASPGGASPFAPPPGLETPRHPAPPRPVDPFASAIPRDALAFQSRDVDRDPPVLSGDVWETRQAPRAGDWNATSAAPPREHDKLIGSERAWSEPPPEGPRDLGYGFDAPFNRPLLKEVSVPPQALMIPSDWDEPDPRPAAPPSRFAAAPEPAPLPDRAPRPQASRPPPVVEPRRPPTEAPVWPDLPPPLQKPAVEAPPPVAAPKGAAPAVAAGPERLLLAFCEGAKLDPADLAGEDPAEVMRRAGVIYQQMVLGLSDLLSERTSLKNEYRMVRTSVRPEGNNPFKWAPPRRVALDLLKGRDDGFLSGPAAVRESFEDLKKHLLCLLASMRASLAATLDALSPSTIERRMKTPAFVIRGSRAAAAWAEYERVFADFQQQADDNPDSQVNREFRAAYERQLRELDDLSAKT